LTDQKADPARRDPDNYPLCFTQRIIYADMDAFRHLNNGATGRYMEEGRAALNMEVFGDACMIDPPDGLQILFANVVTDFLAQAHYPGTALVTSAVGRIGRTSWTVVQGTFQQGTCFAMSEAVMVKARNGRPEPLSADEITALSRLMLRRPEA